MGKVKAWLMDMEAEAVGMTKKEFIKQYGLNELGVWEKANAIDSGEPDMSDLEPSQEEIDRHYATLKTNGEKLLKDTIKKLNGKDYD
jgi:bisphosphoglycerate-dependent phosphoglycerate mutase|tara:strand:- start:1635 stop:1895 length:261 start_codon:yes stop_codon:yes gene_type:complete